MEIDNEKLIQIAKEKGIEIDVNSPNPGVYDKSTNTFYAFEELFPDVMKRNSNRPPAHEKGEQE